MALRVYKPDEISPTDLTNIIVYAMRLESFGQIAAEKLLPQHLNREEEQYIRIVWEVLSNYILAYRSCPSRDILTGEIERLLGSEEYQWANEEDFLAGLDEYLDFIYNERYDLPDAKYIKKMLSDFLTFRVKDVRYEELKLANLPYEKLAESMAEVNKATLITEGTTIKPFGMEDEDGSPFGLGTRDLLPYGVDIFDEMFGGFALGEVMGVTGLTGGGKTLILVQLACAAALSGVPVLYCSYEQGFSGDVAERFYSYSGEFNRNLIKNLKYKEYPPEVKEVIKNIKKSALKDNLMFMDMTLNNNGVNGLLDVQGQIERHADEGFKPKIVIIDWLVPFLSRAGLISNEDKSLISVWGNTMGNSVKDFAITNQVHLIIAHQLNTDVLKKPVTYKPTNANAYNLGVSFSQYMQIALAIGQRDADGTCWLNPCKVRSAAPLPKIVKMNGAFCRFEPLDNYSVRNGKFVDKIGVGNLLDFRGMPLTKATAAKNLSNSFEGKEKV